MLVAASVVGMALAFAEKYPCRSGAWNYYAKQFQDACYTDIYPLYYNEGLAAGKVPYTGHKVEYPVLIGGAMQAAAWLVRNVNPADQGPRVLRRHRACCSRSARWRGCSRPRGRPARARRAQALMVALSPALILSAFINWDLIAFALTALGIAAWAGRRAWWAGVLLGLGVAAKFYPLVVFGPLLLLCLRTGQLRPVRQDASRPRRGLAGGQPAGDDRRAVRLGLVLCLQPGPRRRLGLDLVPVRALQRARARQRPAQRAQPIFGGCSSSSRAPRSPGSRWPPRAVPRLPQLCFLVLAAFLMTNKVWSPQYVVWLVPLAVLARPRLWPYLLWQLAEVAYFFAIWGYLIFVVRQRGLSRSPATRASAPAGTSPLCWPGSSP